MFSAQTDNDMICCPYNKAHRMLRKRLQPHLIKCRGNYPDVELQKCPFNQTHLIPEPEFVFHVTNCSDRKLITQYKYDAPEAKEEERIKHEPIECEENWDDTEVEDYNPKKYIESANVLRRPEGTQPSQRKEFIKKERKRLGDYDSADDLEIKVESVEKKKDMKHEIETFGNDGYERKYAPPPTLSPPSVSHWERRNAYRSRSPSLRVSHDSPSPPPHPLYTRDRYGHRDRREYRERHEYRDRSPLQYKGTNSTPPPSAPSMHSRESPDYDLDDDPYYNGGSSSSTTTTTSREDEYGASSRYYNYAAPYYSSLPGGSPYGRGAYRGGHPYERRYVGPTRSRYDP